MFIRSALLRFAPASGKVIGLFGVNFFTRMYYDWYKSSRNKLTEWHKHELERLDRGYALQQAGHRLVVAREEALSKGIGPLDPDYPDLYDFYK